MNTTNPNDSELIRLIGETLRPDWQQCKATPEQLDAIATRQQLMAKRGRLSYLMDQSGYIIDL